MVVYHAAHLKPRARKRKCRRRKKEIKRADIFMDFTFYGRVERSEKSSPSFSFFSSFANSRLWWKFSKKTSQSMKSSVKIALKCEVRWKHLPRALLVRHKLKFTSAHPAETRLQRRPGSRCGASESESRRNYSKSIRGTGDGKEKSFALICINSRRKD